MATNKYKFELPPQRKPIIKVIGVGGGGNNAVNHMFHQGIKDVEFIVCNTDGQALETSPVQIKLQIGESGLGAGANPEKGRNAAIESREEIKELLAQNTKMLFITAGMGGGTGTGAAPEIAKIANEMDILTVGIVTMPFGFEGKPKFERAEAGIRELKQYCDTVLVILNDKLREVFSNLTMSNAFSQADNVLTTAAKSIAEIITVPGYINVDFEDVKTVMAKSGTAVMGSSTSEGEHRARRAAEEALSSPLLNNVNIHGAQKILLSIRSGTENELSMEELDEITNYIQQRAGDAAEVIFGHGIDEALGERVGVTVIATGFDVEGFRNEGNTPSKKIYDLNSNKVVRKEEMEDSPKSGFTSSTPPDQELHESDRAADGRQADEYYNIGDKDIRFDLEGPYEELNEDTEERHSNTTEALQQKKEALQRAALERVKMLKGIKSSYQQDNNEEETIREKIESPAYKRRKVQLQEIVSSDEHHISRYTLDGETGSIITTQNRFLHDKPC